MINNKFLIIIFIYLLCSISKAHAYLDPGTGSIILQAILGFIAAAAATVSIYWEKFKSIINKVLKRDTKDNKDITKH
jgi:glycerol uptake facilitator-like aquaporin